MLQVDLAIGACQHCTSTALSIGLHMPMRLLSTALRIAYQVSPVSTSVASFFHSCFEISRVPSLGVRNPSSFHSRATTFLRGVGAAPGDDEWHGGTQF